MPNCGTNNVAGVGHVNKDAVEPSANDGLGKGAGGVGGAQKLAVTGLGDKSHVACGVDDDVTCGKVLIAVRAVDDTRIVRNEAEGVAQVLNLGYDLLVVVTDEVELVGDSLEQQAVGHVGTDVAKTDDADLTGR